MAKWLKRVSAPCWILPKLPNSIWLASTITRPSYLSTEKNGTWIVCWVISSNPEPIFCALNIHFLIDQVEYRGLRTWSKWTARTQEKASSVEGENTNESKGIETNTAAEVKLPQLHSATLEKCCKSSWWHASDSGECQKGTSAPALTSRGSQ